MNRKIKCICAAFSETQNEVFNVDCIPDFSYQDDCIKWHSIQFFGKVKELSDDNYEAIDRGDYSNMEKIGNIVGCIILGDQIVKDGEDIHNVCDDVDGDLEYITSALSDPGQPLDNECGLNIFYIHKFSVCEDFSELFLKARILNELPYLCLKFLHVKPDIITFYPEPLEYNDIDEDDEALKKVIYELAMQKIEAFTTAYGKGIKKNENIVNIGAYRQFTEDEINVIMGRRRPGRSYPENAINKKEFEFYESNGFKEAGDSRVLYKLID